MTERLRDMRNLGPASERMLAEIDVTTPDALRDMGAEEAFQRLRFQLGNVSRNALYAMRGALADRHWWEMATPEVTLVRGCPRTHGAACAAIMHAWNDENEWMPRLHDLAETEAFVAYDLFDKGFASVALADDEPIGFVCVGSEGYVYALFVADDARGKGIGTALLDGAKRYSRQGLSLSVFQANEAAQRFYVREGFREVSRTDGDNAEGLPDVLMRWDGDL